jgi:MFS family permease
MTTQESNFQRRARLRANLPKLNLLAALRGALLIVPVLVPFFQEYGLSLTEIFWLQAIFGIAVALFEVPSGYFSDSIGRKASLVIGAIGVTLGFGAYALASNFWGFLVGELILAVGCGFISGSDSAIVFDTLVELDEEDRYASSYGRQRSLANFSEAASSIAGAALAVVSLHLPLFLQVGVCALSIPVALSLTEPKRQRFSHAAGPWAGMLDIVKEALGLRREIRQLIVLSAVLMTATLTMVWFTQPWLGEAQIPLAAFGIVWAALRIGVGVSALCAARLEASLGFNRTVALMLIVLACGFGLCAWQQSAWLIPALLAFSFVRGTSLIVFSEAINRATPSDRRATVLSIESLLCRLLFAPLAPLVGWVADAYSLSTAIALSGAVFALGTAFAFRRLLAPRQQNTLTELPIIP